MPTRRQTDTRTSISIGALYAGTTFCPFWHFAERLHHRSSVSLILSYFVEAPNGWVVHDNTLLYLRTVSSRLSVVLLLSSSSLSLIGCHAVHNFFAVVLVTLSSSIAFLAAFFNSSSPAPFFSPLRRRTLPIIIFYGFLRLVCPSPAILLFPFSLSPVVSLFLL